MKKWLCISALCSCLVVITAGCDNRPDTSPDSTSSVPTQSEPAQSPTPSEDDGTVWAPVPGIPGLYGPF